MTLEKKDAISLKILIIKSRQRVIITINDIWNLNLMQSRQGNCHFINIYIKSAINKAMD
jgi:hypothetical protein